MRLLPVKSSAPATTTRIRPSENATPPSRRSTPNGTSDPPAVTVVAKMAPRAMKAPARTESASVSAVDISALPTPTCSAFRAISRGGSASRPVGVNTGSATVLEVVSGVADGTVCTDRAPLPWLSRLVSFARRLRQRRGECADRVRDRRRQGADAEHLEPAADPAETGDERASGAHGEQRREREDDGEREAKVVRERDDVGDE